MTAPFSLRPVSEGDLARLVVLYQQCEKFLRLASAAPIDAEMVRADLELSAAEGGTFFGIWLADGTLAGVIDCALAGYEGQRDLAFIILLMIGAPWRQLGLGREAVRRVAELVWQDPLIQRFQTAVQVDNPGAVAFWERVGFKRISGPRPQPDGTVTYLLAKERPT